MEASMQLFQRAQIGEVAAVVPRPPRRLLLALDGSEQDDLGVALARGLLERFKGGEVTVIDAREQPGVDDLAPGVAARLQGQTVRAAAKGEGESFQQILEAVQQHNCDLVVVPCPFGRDFESVGVDSAGTVIDVLLSRCPVSLLSTRKPYAPSGAVFGEVILVLIGENEAEGPAAEAAAAMVAPEGKLTMLLLVEEEFYENVQQVLRGLDSEVEVTPEAVAGAIAKNHMRLHRALQKAAAEQGFQYELLVLQEDDPQMERLAADGHHPLVVLPLERTDHASQGHVRDRLRNSPHPVLVVHVD